MVRCFGGMNMEFRDEELVLADGRTVAWTEYGPHDGVPLVRVPGTPSSRWAIRSDRDPWDERSLFVVTTERPGFGRSTRLPGRGFTEHADDIAAILDNLGIEQAYVSGGSGAAPHILAMCARHPDRVIAATVLAGISPLEPAEADGMIGLNRTVWECASRGDWAGIRDIHEPLMQRMRADPLASFEQVMATAPAEDQAVIRDEAWREVFTRSIREAFRQGVEGWTDASLAAFGNWPDIDPSMVRTSVTWWHGTDDRNTPYAAAKRLVSRLPNTRLITWPAGAGHMYAYQHEGEILDELLARTREI